MNWLKRLTTSQPRYPVELEGGLQILAPIESLRADAWVLRVYDPHSDIVITEHVASWAMASEVGHAVDAIISSMIRRLEVIVWAMRKFDIPPSWQTAYYRACGEWPEGFS